VNDADAQLNQSDRINASVSKKVEDTARLIARPKAAD
jgi:hypothetical protein